VAETSQGISADILLKLLIRKDVILSRVFCGEGSPMEMGIA
jgi:hypothetical protein